MKEKQRSRVAEHCCYSIEDKVLQAAPVSPLNLTLLSESSGKGQMLGSGSPKLCQVHRSPNTAIQNNSESSACNRQRIRPMRPPPQYAVCRLQHISCRTLNAGNTLPVWQYLAPHFDHQCLTASKHSAVFLSQSFNLASAFGFTNFIRFQCVMNKAKKVNGRVQAGIHMYQHV